MRTDRETVERVATWLEGLARGWRGFAEQTRNEVLDTHVAGASDAASLVRTLEAERDLAREQWRIAYGLVTRQQDDLVRSLRKMSSVLGMDKG